MDKRHWLRNALVVVLFVASLLAMIGLGWPAFGQAVDSSQIKKATNGGIVGDSANAVWAAPYRGTTAPSGPVTGAVWQDTNYSPAILKSWNGSSWVALNTSGAISTQADTSSFPGSPVDGQILFSASPPSLWVYSTTLGAWATFAQPLVTSAANIRDIYTSAVIAAPGAATAATSGTSGSLSAGTYSYQITCRNSTGGETTGGTVSNTITSLASASVDLSSIPTCATGGVQRNIYRTKVNGSGPWYWVGNLADNTTTTYHDGLADSSAVGLAPDINFSAALPGAWTVLNVGSFTSGGCGGTGATRGSMVCYNGANATAGELSVSTDGVNLRASLDISSYTSGNYTMTVRYVKWSQNGDTYPTAQNTVYFNMRYGTYDNAQRITHQMGQINGYGADFFSPFSPSNRGNFYANARTTSGGTSYGNGNYAMNNPWPEIDAFPLWLKVIRRSGTINTFLSGDGVVWTSTNTITGSTNTTSAQTSWNAGAGSNYAGDSSLNHVEIPVGNTVEGTPAGAGPWIEIDSFTLAVN